MPRSSWNEEYARRQESLLKDIYQKDFGYTYPKDSDGKEMDLRVGSELHDWIISRVNRHIEGSRSALSAFHNQWRQSEWTLNAYMPPDSDDVFAVRKDSRKPVCIVAPLSFENLETYLSYNFGVFLGQRIIYPLWGTGGASRHIEASLMENCLALQNLWFNEALALNTIWRDNWTYGFGVAATAWSKHRSRVRPEMREADVVDEVMQSVTNDLLFANGLTAKDIDAAKSRMREYRVLYEGDATVPIDPWLFYWDQNVPVDNAQAGAFVGWQYSTDAMNLLGAEDDPEERLFNCQQARILATNGGALSRYWTRTEAGRNVYYTGAQEHNVASPVDITVHYEKLIPYECNLGSSKRPELWMFRVASDRVVVGAQPLDLDHGMFPIVVNATNTDGHQIVPTAHLMVTYGLQRFTDFKINAAAKAERKSLNGLTIVDPYFIELDDILQPEWGIARLKETAMGRGDLSLDTYLKIVNSPQRTAQDFMEIQGMMQVAKEGLGTSDIMRGDLSGMPERPGQAGVNAATSMGMSRLQRLAKITWQQVNKPLAYQHAFNTMQFMDEDVRFAMTPKLRKYLERTGTSIADEEVVVSSDMLTPYFTMFPTDGVPRAQRLQTLDKILQIFLQNPNVAADLATRFPIVDMFKQWAIGSGMEDIVEYEAQPDEQVQQQIQAGNLVPMNAGGMSNGM